MNTQQLISDHSMFRNLHKITQDISKGKVLAIKITKDIRNEVLIIEADKLWACPHCLGPKTH